MFQIYKPDEEDKNDILQIDRFEKKSKVSKLLISLSAVQHMFIFHRNGMNVAVLERSSSSYGSETLYDKEISAASPL